MRAALAGVITASPASPVRGDAVRRPVGGCTRRSHQKSAASSTSTAPTEDEVNAYDVLGVDVTASHRAVRDAFRQKAKDAHPDRGGTPEAFDALKRAQDVLTDDGKRAALDSRLLDVPIGSLSLEELKWSRELQRLAEEEKAGEVRGADAVLASARAYAAAEKALEAIAAKKKKDAAKRDEEKKDFERWKGEMESEAVRRDALAAKKLEAAYKETASVRKELDAAKKKLESVGLSKTELEAATRMNAELQKQLGAPADAEDVDLPAAEYRRVFLATAAFLLWDSIAMSIAAFTSGMEGVLGQVETLLWPMCWTILMALVLGTMDSSVAGRHALLIYRGWAIIQVVVCLLYTSPSPRD